ncbi:MAG: cyclic nucleotide-binding domain-containing protein [Acidobacteria bacterium]|nr:cyclic nucleotide-binding domain-containing protein [Acidobacteriota bacterium]
MTKQITKHRDILRAIENVEIISELVERRDGHYVHELDLEVIAYGRNYNGKKVGPYVRLFEYAPGEVLLREGDWGGNTFYISVAGALDVYVKDTASGEDRKVGEIPPGTSFGEMSVLAGIPRNATIRVPPDSTASVLELTRPALRLLRKFPRFGQQLDATYRQHGLARALVEVKQFTGDAFSAELIEKLGQAARFMVYSRHHVLFREGDPVDRVVFIRNGWVRRVRGMGAGTLGVEQLASGLGEQEGVDFLGEGNCLGLEGVSRDRHWGYTATVLQRTEALEVSIPRLRADERLRETLARTFADFSLADDVVSVSTRLDKRVITATEREIATGIVDGANLLVMDMDKCVRCGNCSLACHKVHGQSRLLRRGIHIERPLKLGGVSTQHVLVPSVCMHCQDPECLTGCPTGAIGRFVGGQIDIDPKTCIGCGDCATQCPYNAISMIQRKPDAPAPEPFAARITGWLNLAPEKLPPPVAATENLLAAKCNLCAGTRLNPPGARTESYSCQENCPTGALVRVNPREYFTEVNQRLGFIYRDQTHAIGRNIHKRDTLARLFHAFGIVATIAVVLLIVRGLLRHGLDGRLGDTWLTLRWITGLVGLFGVAAVMTYPARKQVYRRRAGPLRYWMLAHVYLGLIAGVVLLLHGGRATGGLLTSALMMTFDAVILTGLFGLACYYVCPRVMTSIEGEPLLVEDLQARRAELRATLSDIAFGSGGSLHASLRRKARGRFLSVSFLLRQYFRREPLPELLASARGEFEGEARSLDAESRHTLLEIIEASVTLRRVDSLIYLHQLLKLWLAPHVVATSLMLVLMLVHVIQVVFFAVR